MKAGALPEGPLPDGDIQRPQNPEHGDYASNLAMKLARQARMNPLEIADRIAGALPPLNEVAEASAVRPGFINFKLAEGWLTRQVETVLAEGDGYADSAAGAGRKVQVEFVSVNPTGPVHVGHARGAVLGSTLGERARRRRLRRRTRVLRQRRRQPDGQLLRLALRPRRAVAGHGRGAARRRLRRRLRHRRRAPHPRRGVRPRRARRPHPRRQPRRCVPQARRGGPSAHARPHPRRPRSPRRRVRRLVQRAVALRAGERRRLPLRGVDGRRCATAAISPSARARRGSPRPASARTRTTSSSEATARRPTSRRTSPTTATSSGRGASSA